MTPDTRKTKLLSFFQSFLIPFSVLMLFWTIAARCLDSSLILPYPHQVFQRLFELSGNKAFLVQIGFTTLRTLSAFFISFFLSIVLGFSTACIPLLDRLLSLPFTLVRTTPVVSFILLALFWFSSSAVPVFVSVLMTLPVMTSAVYSGIRNTDPKLTEMCSIFGFSRKQKIRWLYLPAVSQNLFSGALSAFGQSWKVTVAAEVISLPKKSAGFALYTAKTHLETTDVFAITFCIILICFILESLFRTIYERFCI